MWMMDPSVLSAKRRTKPTGLDWQRTRFHDYHGDPRHLRGYLLPCDVLINSTGNGTLGRVGYFVNGPDAVPCVADGHVTVARADRHIIESRYLYYWLNSTPFQDYVYAALVVGATNQVELNRERLAGAPVPLPPLDEQRRIADFLDAESGRIDALRAARGHQVAVLDELELARIGEHLTATETVGPVYAYFDVQLGKMLNAERASGVSQNAYLRNANVHWYEIDVDDMATMTFEPDERHRYGVQAGDLLVCEGGAGVAEAAVWDGRVSPCFYQKSLHRVRARSYVPVEWLMYWLRHAKAIGIFDAGGNIATIPHLTGEQLAEYRIPIPDDGNRRVTELASEITSIREAQDKMAAANELLGERRRALITAAVTGEISV